MTNDKLNALINSLLNIAESENNPFKYNNTICELLLAENMKNVIVFNHLEKPVVIFNNADGGITVMAAKTKELTEDKE